MRAAFNLFENGSGGITQDGLMRALKTIGKDMSAAELRTLIGGDVDGFFTARGGKMDYETFCAIINMDLKKAPEQITDLQEAFKRMDPDGKGFIGKEELRYICLQLGVDLTGEEVGTQAQAVHGWPVPACTCTRAAFSSALSAVLTSVTHRPVRPSDRCDGEGGAYRLRWQNLLRRAAQNSHHAVIIDRPSQSCVRVVQWARMYSACVVCRWRFCSFGGRRVGWAQHLATR